MRHALITGISGQDGSYLAELLLGKGYAVHGIIRRHSAPETQTTRIDHLRGHEQLRLYYGDLTDGAALARLVRRVEPDEIYNLAAQSHVRVSFDQPVYTTEVVYVGTLRLLEAVREWAPEARVYQASSSEMFGSSPPPHDEETPFAPMSPYAVAKVAAHHLAGHYRDAYGLRVSCGILFNHESPRRGESFVTRKITRALGRIVAGLQDKIVLGNLDAVRDWGYAPDYVEAMWRMLQQGEPDDYIVATGKPNSVNDFLWAACGFAEGIALQRIDPEVIVEQDERFMRPSDVPFLQGDATKARDEMLWRPSVDFLELVGLMVQSDIELARREAAARGLATPHPA